MADMMTEVAGFRDWAAAYPRESGHGEWECDYNHWPNLYDAVLEFADARPFASWSAEELRAVLYAVARGNEMQHLANEISSRRDENEYVRRRSLRALARLGSLALEELALAAWHRPDDNQEWSRMMVLWCLHRAGSPHLEPLLTEAEQDKRPYLSDFAKKVRRGEVES